MVRIRQLFRFRVGLRPLLGKGRLTTRRALILFVVVLFASSIVALIYHTYKASAAYTCLNGGDHGGAAWDPATDCPGGIAGNHTNIGAFTINTGETATVQAYNGSQYGSVQISAATINITGTLTALGKGFPGGTGANSSGSGPGGGIGNGCCGGGGGGYGGNGGNGTSAAGGSSYGSYTAPTSLGSGGGGGGNGVGGSAGGGAIQLTVTGTTTINGTVVADGASEGAIGDGNRGGGGSGGSVYITTGTFTGSGTVTANGGNGSANGGNGGGGRIYIGYSSANTFSGSAPTVNAGTGGAGSPQPGTALVVDTTNNDLYISTSQTWNANPTHEGTSSWHNVTVSNNATWTMAGYYTTNTNGVGVVVNATNNFTLNTGSTITAAGLGYAAGAGGAGHAGSGPGGGASTGGGGGGGGYGGSGSTGNSAGGSAYGSYIAPVDLGSGGGGGANGQPGAAGGGAVKINAAGTVTISGTISVNGNTSTAGSDGNDGGGGSGGSVYIISGTFTGSGSITANGGNGISNGGGGAGGRIFISFSSVNTYSGTAPTVTAGTGGAANGQAGTCLIYDSTNKDLTISTSQTWNANPSLEGSAFTYRNVTVTNNATWTMIGYHTTNTDGVGMQFSVTNFTLNTGSTISLDGKGYSGGSGAGVAGSGPGGGSANGGGGGYGGAGATSGNGGAGGQTYGSVSAPVNLGSGGAGGGNGAAGGAGGGAIKIGGTGTVTISGTITTNGLTGGVGTGDANRAGGGSGGSVYITSSTFTGGGTITANGGNASSFGGNGGGGRIAIYFSSANTYSGTITAATGTGGFGSAQPGSSIIANSATNDIYLYSSQTWSANPNAQGSSVTYNSITLEPGVTLTIQGYASSSTTGVGMKINVHDLTVPATATITATNGFSGGTSGAGAGPGGGAGVGCCGGGGGGYGGSGGNGTSATGGTTYGNKYQPLDLGSGGGKGGNGAAGAAGGGAVWINATGTVTINGSVTAPGLVAPNGTDNNNGGGGSGGSIFIVADTFTGSGSISASGGNGNASGGGGSGGRVAINYGSSYSWTGTALDAAHSAAGGAAGATGGSAGANGTVLVIHHALLDRSVTMSNSGPGAPSVSYEVSIKSAASTTVGGIVVDACDDTPTFGAATCAYPSGFSWGGATPGLTVNGGMGSGWTTSGVQGGAGSGQSQVVELSNATPQSVSPTTPIDFTITTVTNPSSPNHSFYIRVITFNTAGNMTSEYTISGTTRTGNLPDSLDHGGMALSTSSGVSLTFQVPETLTFCVSKVTISNCTTTTPPSIVLGHSIGGQTVLTSTAVDTMSIFTQLSTNAEYGAAVTIKNTNPSALCGGMSVTGGSTCTIPAVNTSCAGSCSATTITAGNAAIGLCVAPGTGSVVATAPYNGASCGSGGNTYGLDDATATNVRSTYGSQIFSSSGPLNGENDTIVFAATASSSSAAGVYTVNYALVATGTF